MRADAPATGVLCEAARRTGHARRVCPRRTMNCCCARKPAVRESAPVQTPLRRGIPSGAPLCRGGRARSPVRRERGCVRPAVCGTSCAARRPARVRSHSRRRRPPRLTSAHPAGVPTSAINGRPGNVSSRQQNLGGVGIVFQVRGLPSAGEERGCGEEREHAPSFLRVCSSASVAGWTTRRGFGGGVVGRGWASRPKWTGQSGGRAGVN